MERLIRSEKMEFQTRTIMGWDEVLKRILDQPPHVDVVQRERSEDAEAFRSLKPSRLEPRFDISTNELAIHRPSSSRPEIIYHVTKIAYHSDLVLSRARADLGLPPPSPELIRLFRWAFSHVVRRHEIFHYLVERSCRIMDENNYRDYRAKVYEKRKSSGQGNLEEALADAYAIVRCRRDLLKMPEPKELPYTIEELRTVFRHILRRNFIGDHRPPGYKEAKRFLEEVKTLLSKDVSTIYAELIASGLKNEDVWDCFRGMSWLFFELTIREPSNFTNPKAPAIAPHSKREFIVFLENFRYEEETWLRFLLELPNEREG